MAGPTTAEVNASTGCKPGLTVLLGELQAKFPGTTSAGLCAGIPNIVVPFTADQPFWGNRVHAMGCR